MGPYLGDYTEDATLDFIWDTNDSSGASITRATDGTVSVYKANGDAQSVAGITDTEDFDGVTGIHQLRIDLSADAFYAVGNDYSVVLSAATIDGQTVNAVLCSFSIENRFQEVDLTHVMGTILTEGAGGQLAAAIIKLFDVATPLLVASDVMRGTDSAALASVATEARLAELDAANLPADITAIPTTAMRGTDGANTTTPPTTAAIATAVLASTIDTGLDMTKALKVILALAIAKEVAVSGNTYTFKDQDGNTLVTITFAAGSSTAVIA